MREWYFGMMAIGAESLIELLGDDKEQRHWLILEETGQTLSALYSLSTTLDYEWLFQHTPYAGSLKRSPLVLRLDNASHEVRRAFEANPSNDTFRGIVISSRHSQDAVLAHLRHCLDVRFYGNRQAMLRYYHPAIAACLFSLNYHPNRQWLGPLDQWVWFEATPQTQDNERLQWHALRDQAQADPAPPSQQSPQPITLSSGQENALEQYIRAHQAQRTQHTLGARPTTVREGSLT